MKSDYPTSYFWNSLELSSPVISPCGIIAKRPSAVGTNLLNCFKKIISELSSLDKLNDEGAMLSRLVYRYKRKLRPDKGFKSLQKINHLLHNYLKMKFLSMMEQLKNGIYETSGPSRQMMEWCLVGILRFSALFHKIYIICMDGGRYLKCRIASGDFWSAAALCYASVSRIWSLSQDLVKRCSVWYTELKDYLPYLGSADLEWLPEDFELPQTVSEWLKYPPYLNIESASKRLKSETEQVSIESDGNVNSSHLLTCNTFTLNEDFGESVSRETGEVIHQEDSNLKRRNKGRKQFDHLKKSKTENIIKSLNSMNAIIEFMCKEGVLRQAKTECITMHLTDAKWKQMKEALSKHMKKMTKLKTDEEENQQIVRAVKCIQFYIFHSDSDNELKD